MTRDEAIDRLENMAWIRTNDERREDIQEAIDMEIEALSEQSEQVTGKLKKPCDSLLTGDSDNDKEHERKLEPSKVDFRTDESANIGAEVNDPISRADAIERLKYHTDFIKDRNYADGEELLYKESAIAQINALPTADRPSMIPIKLEKRYPQSKDEDITDAFMRGYMQGKSADRPTGEWVPEINVKTSKHGRGTLYRCSACNGYSIPCAYNYCPNCGAKMEGPDHE